MARGCVRCPSVWSLSLSLEKEKKKKTRRSQRVTFRAAGYCQNACRRSVACKRWIRGNPARAEGPRAAFISGACDSTRTTMCRWVPAVFSGMPSPTAASCLHNVNNCFVFFKPESAKELIARIMVHNDRFTFYLLIQNLFKHTGRIKQRVWFSFYVIMSPLLQTTLSPYVWTCRLL